jgi:type VI secretion system protein ImpF
LLEAAESAMALPCSRAWLDLQRFVVEACDALGSDYEAIVRAIRSELKALVTDIPQLLDATLMDDTPAANAETRAWLVALTQAPAGRPAAAELPLREPRQLQRSGIEMAGQPTDAYASAVQALREGQERKAFEILQQDIARKRSGRERFRRRMQLVEICASTNKANVAQPILDDLAAAIETPQARRVGRSGHGRRRSGHDHEDEHQDSGGQGAAAKIVRAHLPARSGAGAGRREVIHGQARCYRAGHALGAGPAHRSRSEDHSEIPLTRAQSLRELKLSLKRDLEWLLNTRETIDLAPDSARETSAPFTTTGFPDISSKSVLSARDQSDLVREMESAIAIFEPRLKRAKVRMEPVEGSYRALKFVIEGLLCMDPAPEPVRFDTVLELGKGEYEIKGADLAQ